MHLSKWRKYVFLSLNPNVHLKLHSIFVQIGPKFPEVWLTEKFGYSEIKGVNKKCLRVTVVDDAWWEWG